MQKLKYVIIFQVIFALWANGFIGPVMAAYASPSNQGMFICTSFGLQPINKEDKSRVVSHCKYCMVSNQDDWGDSKALSVYTDYVYFPQYDFGFVIDEYALHYTSVESHYAASRGPPLFQYKYRV